MPKRLLKFSAKAGAAVLVSVLVLELLLRAYLHPVFDFLRVTENDPYKWARLPPSCEKRITDKMRLSPLTRAVKYQYTVRSNSQGLRADRDYEPSPSAPVFRIILLGDSITFGWDIESEYTWSVLLEKELARLRPDLNAEVINAGFPAYSSRQGLISLDRDLLKLKPQVVVVQFGFNDNLATWQRMSGPIRMGSDAEVMAGAPGRWRPIRMGWREKVTTRVNSAVTGRMAMVLYTMVVTRGHASDPRVPPEDFKANLLAMQKLCKDAGARMVLIDSWGLPDSYRDLIRDVARENNIELFSQARLMEKSIWDLKALLAADKYQPFVQIIRSRFPEEFLKKNPRFYLLNLAK